MRWTAGQQGKQLILHLRHDLYQIFQYPSHNIVGFIYFFLDILIVDIISYFHALSIKISKSVFKIVGLLLRLKENH